MDRARVVSGVASLPNFPASIARLQQVAQDERSSARDFEAVVQCDVSLAANVLRMANSPFFGQPRKVQGIGHAISLLGTARVLEAAMGSSFMRLIPARIAGYDVEARTFWLHSAAVSVLGGALARELRIPAPDLLSCAGLFHDAGKLVMGEFLAEMPRSVAHQLDGRCLSLIDLEGEVLGVDHAQVGAEVALRWNLPAPIGWAARHHHDPCAAPREVDPLLVGIIHLADCMAHMLGYGSDAAELHRRIDPQVIEQLQIKVDQLDRVAVSSVAAIREMGEVYDRSPPNGK